MSLRSWQEKTSDYYTHAGETLKDKSVTRSAFLASVDHLVSVSLRDGDRLLDVGSGDGRRIRGLTNNHDIQITFLEPSDLAKMIKPTQTNETLIQDNFENANFSPGNKFDVITMLWNVLGHTYEPNVLIQKAFDLLEEGGKLMLDVNNFFNIKEYGVRSVWANLRFAQKGFASFELKADQFEASVKLFSPLYIRRALRSSGFRSIKSIYVNYENGQHERNFMSGQLFLLATK